MHSKSGNNHKIFFAILDLTITMLGFVQGNLCVTSLMVILLYPQVNGNHEGSSQQRSKLVTSGSRKNGCDLFLFSFGGGGKGGGRNEKNPY